MNKKNFIRVAVLSAVFAWPAVECFRLSQAKEELLASEQRLNAVSVKLASARSVEVAEKALPAAARKP